MERYQTEKILLLFHNCFWSLLHTPKDCHASWLAPVTYNACWVMRSLFHCKMHLYRWVIMISKQNDFQLSFESNGGLLWVCFTLICDWWSRKKLTPPSWPIKYKTKTNPNMATCVFPRLKQIASFYFKFSLVEHAVNICSDC